MGIDGAAWLGLAGVVTGAALGFASSAAQEAARRRHEQRLASRTAKREDAIRFESRRFDAYVAMITAANRFYGLARYPAVTRVQPVGGELGPLVLAREQFMTTLSPAFLMATSPRTRDGLAALTNAVQALFDGVTAEEDLAQEELEALFVAHRRAVRASEAAMREEFGLELTGPAGS